jgi:dihydrofolate reductase
VTELHTELLAAAGDKDVWVVGGGQTAAQFVSAGLVDELVVSYAPCTLGTGARLLPCARNGNWPRSTATASSCVRAGGGGPDLAPAAGRLIRHRRRAA